MISPATPEFLYSISLAPLDLAAQMNMGILTLTYISPPRSFDVIAELSRKTNIPQLTLLADLNSTNSMWNTTEELTALLDGAPVYDGDYQGAHFYTNNFLLQITRQKQHR